MRQPTCPDQCPGCRTDDDRTTPQPESPPADQGDLDGGRFALAACWVFAGPLLAVIAAQVVLAGQMGEFKALGVGLAGAALVLLPAMRWLRRRPAGEASS